MAIKNFSVDAYKNTAISKAKDQKSMSMLRYGTTRRYKTQPAVRNDLGVLEAIQTVEKVANNFATQSRGIDALSDALYRQQANFAVAQAFPATNALSGAQIGNGTGLNNIVDIKTVGAIDMTLVNLCESLVPFVCICRAVENPTAMIYFNRIRAINNAGGLAQGDAVAGAYMLTNTNLALGPGMVKTPPTTAPATQTATINCGSQLIQTSIVVDVMVNGQIIKGKDYEGVGVLFFQDPGLSGAVDYSTGTVTVTNGTNYPIQVTVSARKDMTGDASGRQVLRVTNDPGSTTINTEPIFLNIEDNIVNQAILAKTQAAYRYGIQGLSPAETLFQSAKSVYVDYVNMLVLRELMDGFTRDDSTSSVTIDLRSYDVGKFAETKNDIVRTGVTRLNAELQRTANVGVTTIVTGARGVALLANVPQSWEANPEASVRNDCLAGTFMGINVYRHHLLDETQPDGDIYFYGVHKDPNEQSGSMVYAEYLPITNTGVIPNFANPTAIASGFYMVAGVKKIMPHLVVRMTAKVDDNGLWRP